MKESVANKTVRMKDLQTSSSAKFCSTQVNSGKRVTELFEMLSLHTFNIFFSNLIEELGIHKANVIVDTCVLKLKIFIRIRTINF